jgi:hypothetical protein
MQQHLTTWADSFTSLQRNAHWGFLSPLKIHRPQLDLNTWTLSPMASMLTIRPSRVTNQELTVYMYLQKIKESNDGCKIANNSFYKSSSNCNSALHSCLWFQLNTYIALLRTHKTYLIVLGTS